MGDLRVQQESQGCRVSGASRCAEPERAVTARACQQPPDTLLWQVSAALNLWWGGGTCAHCASGAGDYNKHTVSARGFRGRCRDQHGFGNAEPTTAGAPDGNTVATSTANARTHHRVS